MLQSEHLKEKPVIEELLSAKGGEAYFQFLEESCRNRQTKIIYITFPVKCDDPLHWFRRHSSNYSSRFYWEIPSRSSAIAALGRSEKLSFEGTERFKRLEDTLQKAGSTIAVFDLSENESKLPPRWLGGFSFYPRFNSSDWSGFQPASFILPEAAIVKEDDHTVGCISIKLGEGATTESLHHKISERVLLFNSEYIQNGLQDAAPFGKQRSNNPVEIPDVKFQQWSEAIRDAKAGFNSGNMEKVVLTRKKQFSFDKPCDPIHSLSRLRQHYPEGCSFLIKNDHSPVFLGCSPELLLSVKDHSIETEALAGSIARGKTEQEDNKLAKKLLASAKDQQEHNFVVRSIRKNLSPFLAECDIPDEPAMKKLPNVQHLYTPVKGKMENNASILQMLERLHPTPAVGGTPRSPALSFIKNREPFERGWFASPIGWITASGSASFYVAIRSGLVNEKQALLFAGCGIVEDSDPRAEWEEANLKFKPMLSVLPNE